MKGLSSLEALARELGLAISPLKGRLAPAEAANFFAELGIRFSPVPSTSNLQTASDSADAIDAALQTLIDALDQGNTSALLAPAKDIGTKAGAFQTALKDVSSDLKSSSPPQGVSVARLNQFADDLTVDVLSYAGVIHLENHYPRILQLLRFLEIVIREFDPGTPGVGALPPHIIRHLDIDQVKELVESPDEILRILYGWGEQTIGTTPGTLRIAHLLDRLERLLDELGANTFLKSTSASSSLDIDSFTLEATTAVSPPGLQLKATDPVAATGSTTSPTMWDNVSLETSVTTALDPNVTILIQPPLKITATTVGNVALSGEISAALHGLFPAADAYLILGDRDGSRVEVSDFIARSFANFHWTSPGPTVIEAGAEAAIKAGKVVLDSSGGDGFLAKILPANPMSLDFSIGVGYSNTRGIYFTGSGSLHTSIPLHASLGPLTFETLYIDLTIAADAIRLTLSIAASAEIGPVAASVDRVGAKLILAFVTGNVGPFDLSLRFKPPSGLGIVIDAGAVTGGGYIFFDEDAGRYAGVLQLELKGFAIKAIGILDTKLPGGEKGYSFLIIISAEFSPISLAMGFTLNGVGGLAGIHRTMVIAELQAGIRSHATDDILFPQDPIKNAPRIISDLIRFFPPKKSHYIFGPMALIGWGAPTLLTVKLGIILELPPPIRIVLLGQLDCALPDASAAILELHVDILGVLDFGEKSFALDGTIHDSIIGPFSLFGDFAVRLRWGSARTFALAIGGFNPHFQQIPSGFPSLRRMTLALSGGDNPRVTMQCYFALTSNSLQFGSRADVYASEGKYNVSGWIGFDVLILFHPFELRADFTAGFALRRGSKYLAGVQVDATITGPAPWHVWGSASISILFIKASVNFDATIGDPGPAALPSLQIWASLETSMKEKGNWSGVMPVAASQVVSLKAPSDAFGPLIDPVGNITLIERTAPFARRVTRFADAIPNGASRFDVTTVTIASSVLATNAWHYAMELFAPAQFEQLSDAQKLSRPSFETMAAGVALADRVLLGAPVVHDLTYRTVVIDKPFVSHDADSYPLTAELQLALAGVSRAALGGMRNGTDEKYVAPGTKPLVTLDDEQYVVANTDDLASRTDIAAAGTKGAVESALDDYLVQHASERGRFTVVALAEAA